MEETSPIVEDVLFNSTDFMLDNNDDSLFSINHINIDIPCNPVQFFSSMDMLALDNSKEETKSIDEPILDILQDNLAAPTALSMYTEQRQNISLDHTSMSHCTISLTFVNPPEPVYHVRYLSEITNVPTDGNTINTKKYLSGRYMKGIHGRYIKISLPAILSDSSNLFIRVTRLTVPYQDVSFIHPYPLLYSYVKKKSHSDVIIQGSSIYFKINKEDIYARSKSFSHLILARLKQCQLKQINELYSFDDGAPYPFQGHNIKHKIVTYQLKQSQLDFRLVIRCKQTSQFLNTNIFCRSEPLREEEGIECKKSSTR